MEYLIKFKIALDAITKKISDYTQRENVKIFLSLLYWFIIVYLAYDFYNYGVATGNSTLLTVLIVIVFVKYVKQHSYENRKKRSL